MSTTQKEKDDHDGWTMTDDEVIGDRVGTFYLSLFLRTHINAAALRIIVDWYA
jgi:hypothetical protein